MITMVLLWWQDNLRVARYWILKNLHPPRDPGRSGTEESYPQPPAQQRLWIRKSGKNFPKTFMKLS
jgi:hypothetical protein